MIVFISLGVFFTIIISSFDRMNIANFVDNPKELKRIAIVDVILYWLLVVLLLLCSV